MTTRFDPAAILLVLDRHGVEYVLIGGLAATIHGSAHVTTDVDITPERSARNLTRLSDALSELSARIRVEGHPDGFPFDHDATFLSGMALLNLTTDFGDLDISQTPAGTSGYSDLARDAVDVRLFGVRVRVASLPDVVRSKEAAGRPKDWLTVPSLRRILAEGPRYFAEAQLLANGQVALILRSGDVRSTPLQVRCCVSDPSVDGGPRRAMREADPDRPGVVEVRYPHDFETTGTLPLASGRYGVIWVQEVFDLRKRPAGERELSRTWFEITPEGRFESP